MKPIRFVLLLSVSLLLWACQPASIGVPDKSTSKISASGDPNVAIDCKTGRALTSPAPAEVGIGGASLEHRGDQAVITINFSRSTDLAAAFAAANMPYFGGIGFVDPSFSLPHTNPNWYFDSAQNRGYKWFYDPGTHRFEGFTTYFKDDKWTNQTESLTSVTASGSNLIMTFPWSEVAGSGWYVSVAAPSVCAQLGLGSQGLPSLPLPEGSVSVTPSSVATPIVPSIAATLTPILVPTRTFTPKPQPTFEEPGY
jgi:hypothetical protein